MRAKSEAYDRGMSKAQKAAIQKMRRQRRREHEFWKKIGRVVSKDQYTEWQSLYELLKEQNAALHKRAQLMQYHAELLARREAMQRNLRACIESGVVDDLIVPPQLLVEAERLQ
ncbi:MAG: hypothetical protein MHM6MM_007309 [Cercozoa sp. M6MM]